MVVLAAAVAVAAGGVGHPSITVAVGHHSHSRAHKANWPSVNLDERNSRHQRSEHAIGRRTAHDLTEAWRMDGLDGVTSTPAVWGTTAYFGTWSGQVRAVDVRDGSLVWATQIAPGGVIGYVDGSPLVTSRRVYVAGQGALYALDRATGVIVWSRQVDEHPNTHLYSSPVLAGNVLVIGVASYELVLDKPDFTFRGSVVGLDRASGALRWRLPLTTDSAGASVWSSAAVDERRRLAFIGVGQSYEAPASPLTDCLIAVDYETGKLVWSRQFTADDVFTFFPDLGPGPDWDVGASPNLFRAGGRELVGVADKRGVYAVLERGTGQTVWARELTAGSHLGGVMATAAYARGVIYATSNVMPDLPAGVTDGTSVTFALDARTGDVIWRRAMPGPTFGALSVAGGVLFQPTTPGTLYALDTRTGDVLWQRVPGGELGGGVSISDGRVLTGHGFWFLAQPPNPTGGVVAYDLPGD